MQEFSNRDIQKLSKLLDAEGYPIKKYDGTIKYNETYLHSFNFFIDIIIAIEANKPTITTKKNADALIQIFKNRENLIIPQSIKELANFDCFCNRIKEAYLIIQHENLLLRISIFDNVNKYLENGMLKILARHHKDYNNYNKTKATFFEKEKIVPDILERIVQCRLNGKKTVDDNATFIWNNYKLVIEIENKATIENCKSFYYQK